MKIEYDITPETKVNELLKNYPQLEVQLIAMSPAFAKLRNPVLRRTIARLATLRQVAQIGKIPLTRLINDLRKAAGLFEGTFDDLQIGSSSVKPAWFDKKNIRMTFDARPVLEQGGLPQARVLQDVRNLAEGAIYELITPFLPAPLIDKIKSMGYQVWSHEDQSNVIKTYVTLE